MQDIQNNPAVAIDLHTHTFLSGDSSTSFEEFINALRKSDLFKVAVTDHSTIDGALILKYEYGIDVIVGQEQRSTDGDVIGLFLEKKLPAGLEAAKLCEIIKKQGGLSLIPHPTDESRHSIKIAKLKELTSSGLVDIIEIYNAKVPRPIEQAAEIADAYGVAKCASSDAHVADALGVCKSIIKPFNSPEELVENLKTGMHIGKYFDPPKPWKNVILPTLKKYSAFLNYPS